MSLKKVKKVKVRPMEAVTMIGRSDRYIWVSGGGSEHLE